MPLHEVDGDLQPGVTEAGRVAQRRTLAGVAKPHMRLQKPVADALRQFVAVVAADQCMHHVAARQRRRHR